MVINMKMIKIEKFILLVLVLSLFSLQSVKSLGVSRPLPIDLRLLRGDTARFTFQIQAVTSADKLSCTYRPTALDPIVITFDQNEAIVDAGTLKDIYGTISVPNDAPIKLYNGNLELTCGPYVEVKDFSGSIIHQTINVMFPIEVVLQKEQRIAREIPLPEIEKSKASPIILVLIIIVLTLAIVGFYMSKKKKIE